MFQDMRNFNLITIFHPTIQHTKIMASTSTEDTKAKAKAGSTSTTSTSTSFSATITTETVTSDAILTSTSTSDFKLVSTSTTTSNTTMRDTSPLKTQDEVDNDKDKDDDYDDLPQLIPVESTPSKVLSIIKSLLQKASDADLRTKDGYIFEQIWSSVPDAYPTHAWRKTVKLVDWITSKSSGAEGDGDYIQVFLAKFLRVLVVDRRWFAFRNGLLWTSAPGGVHFFCYGDPAIPSSVVACKFHDCDFPVDTLGSKIVMSVDAECFIVAVIARTRALRDAHERELLSTTGKRPRESTSAAAVDMGTSSATSMATAVGELENVDESMFYTWESIPTPALDSILIAQFHPSVNAKVADEAEMRTIMRTAWEMFMGRPLFEVGEFDKWEVATMLIGTESSSKSAWINALVSIFGLDEVGWLSDRVCDLEQCLGKQVITCYNMDNICADQQQFRSMIAGESVSVESIHLSEDNSSLIHVDAWKTPMLLSGEDTSFFGDNQGSVNRRILPLFFDMMDTPNALLLSEAIAKELPCIIAKAAVAYRTFCTRFGSHWLWGNNVPVFGKRDVSTGTLIQTGITGVLPKYFHEARRRMQTQSPAADPAAGTEEIVGAL